jgi:hypothetical protein
MKVSGAAPDYTGLYQSVTDAQKLDKAELAKAPNRFPEVTMPEGMVALMSEIDEVFDLVKQVKDAKWTPPADHPDLVPVKELERLHNLFVRVKQDPDAKSQPADFQGFLKTSEDLTAKLLDAMKANKPPAELDPQVKAINDACKRCHVIYRDKPQK